MSTQSSTPVLTRNQNEPYWGYEEIGMFLFVPAFLAAVLHLAVAIHLLPAQLAKPQVTTHVEVELFLILVLYLVLKLRHHKPVWKALGWVWPATAQVAAAIVLGSLLAAGVAVYVRFRNQNLPASLNAGVVVLVVLLAPFLEESFFRGFVLPVIARTAGKVLAVFTTALFFAAYHGPAAPAQWAWFTATGVAYGWMRLATRSTTSAALAHASYNLTLSLCSLF